MHEFLTKWRKVEPKGPTAAQSHLNDLCRLLGVEDPIAADPNGEWFTLEKGAPKTSCGDDWRASTLDDDEMMARLFRLNQQRAGAG